MTRTGIPAPTIAPGAPLTLLGASNCAEAGKAAISEIKTAAKRVRSITTEYHLMVVWYVGAGMLAHGPVGPCTQNRQNLNRLVPNPELKMWKTRVFCSRFVTLSQGYALVSRIMAQPFWLWSTRSPGFSTNGNIRTILETAEG